MSLYDFSCANEAAMYVFDFSGASSLSVRPRRPCQRLTGTGGSGRTTATAHAHVGEALPRASGSATTPCRS